MRCILPVSLTLTLLLFLLPALSLPASSAAEAPPQSPTAQHLTDTDRQQTLTVSLQGKRTEMDMEEYLRGVLRAEMPASFEEEALKAQAVCARTYTLYRMENGPIAAHPDADSCDDVNCCKAFLSAVDAAKSWGAEAETYEAKIRRAVAETDGQIIWYDQRPILAAFHSSSSGSTQNVEDVWSHSLPYLVSVESPEGAESVPDYHSSVRFTAEEFRSRFLAAYPAAELTGNVSSWFRSLRKNDAGLTLSLTVGGIAVEGTALRSLLGLRSASFELETDKDGVTFLVTGYGHGVGLSQYGANELAKQGLTWQQILNWYYTGVTIGKTV